MPLQCAIVTKRGSGRRKIAVLADPNCDYCLKFEQELSKIDNITEYVLLYPVVHVQSVRQVKAIWCSKDHAKAWEDFMIRRTEPANVPPCSDPIDKIVAFGNRLGVDATPTWFLENGERHSGVKRHGELRQLLDRALCVTRIGATELVWIPACQRSLPFDREPDNFSPNLNSRSLTSTSPVTVAHTMPITYMPVPIAMPIVPTAHMPAAVVRP